MSFEAFSALEVSGEVTEMEPVSGELGNEPYAEFVLAEPAGPYVLQSDLLFFAEEEKRVQLQITVPESED